MSDTVAAQDHRPECPTGNPYTDLTLCICDRLFACEARLLAPLVQPVTPSASVEGDTADALPPDGSLPTAAGALPVSGAASGGLAEVVGVPADDSHTRMTLERGDSQRHLEECFVEDYDTHSKLCICRRLRACEARVREQTIVSYDMKRAEQAERNGYVSALDAARDAVAAECIAHHGYTPGQTCPYCTDALAAIDGVEKP